MGRLPQTWQGFFIFIYGRGNKIPEYQFIAGGECSEGGFGKNFEFLCMKRCVVKIYKTEYGAVKFACRCGNSQPALQLANKNHFCEKKNTKFNVDVEQKLEAYCHHWGGFNRPETLISRNQTLFPPYRVIRKRRLTLENVFRA